MSDSESWRERGNLLLRVDNTDMDLSERQIKLKMAQNCYMKAIECASNKDETSSAAKNAGTVSLRLASLYEADDIESVKIAKEQFRLALSNFVKALHHGKNRPEAWQSGVDNSIRTSLMKSMEWTYKFSVKFRLTTMEQFINLLPEGATKAEAWYKFAEALFHLAVEELDKKNYQLALKYLKDSNFPLEEARRMKTGANKDLDFANLENDIYVRICVVEALQVKDIAEDLLKTATVEEEYLNMNLAWQIIDTFKDALLLIRNQQVEIEAIIFSRMGYVYDKVMKMEERAHRCYKEASLRAHTSQFKYGDEGWFKETQTFLVEFQKKKVADLEKEDQKWREPIKVEIKPDLDKLETKTKEEVVPFLEFIYKTWPPKKKDNKLNKDVEGDKREKDGKMLRQALLHYHPDKQTREGDGLKWYILCEEICKILNKKYEPLKLGV